MGERIHEPALAVGEAQDAADIGLRELIEKRVVDRFAVAGVLECPSDPSRFQVEMPIFSCRDAPIDFGDACLKLFFKVFQVCLDRLLENFQSRLGNELVLIRPLVITEQIVLHTAEPDAVAAVDIACFQTVAQVPVQEKFIAIW
jgi:hypothetical protein